MNNFLVLFLILMVSVTGCSDGRKTYSINRAVPVIPINTNNGVNSANDLNVTPKNPNNIKYIYINSYNSKEVVLDNYASKYTQVLSNDTQKVVCKYDYLLFLALNNEMKNYINAIRSKYYSQGWRSNYLVAHKLAAPENATNAESLNDLIDRINNNIKLNPDCPEIQHAGNLDLTISVTTSVIDNADTLFEGFEIKQDNKTFCFPCKSSINNQFYYGIVSTEVPVTPVTTDQPVEKVATDQEKPIDVKYAQLDYGTDKEEKCKLSEANFLEIQKRMQVWASKEIGIDPNKYTELSLKVIDLMNNKFKTRDPDVEAKYRLIESVNSFFIENQETLKCPLIYNPKVNNIFVKIFDAYAKDDKRTNFLGLKFIADDLKTVYCLPCESDAATPNLFYYGVYAPKNPITPENKDKEKENEVAAIDYPKEKIQIVGPKDGVDPEFAASRCYEITEDSKLLVQGSKLDIEEICFHKKSSDLNKKDDYAIEINFTDENALPIFIQALPSDASTDYLFDCAKSDKVIPEFKTWLADIDHSAAVTKEALKNVFGSIFEKNFTIKLENLKATGELTIELNDKKILKKKVEISRWNRPACPAAS